MKVAEIIAVLEKIPGETELEISVDISVGEHDSHLRVFAQDFLEFQEPGTLLFHGSPNYPITENTREQSSPNR